MGGLASGWRPPLCEFCLTGAGIPQREHLLVPQDFMWGWLPSFTDLVGHYGPVIPMEGWFETVRLE